MILERSTPATDQAHVDAAAPALEREAAPLRIGLLTGADDRSYALGLASSLVARGISIDFIGSDQVHGPELDDNPRVNFLNLRGDQSSDAPLRAKVARLLLYYARLLKYAAVAEPRLFHILWNNKFEWFDRTLLMAYYRLLGRRIVLTAHNVNAGKRDGRDSMRNRLTLRIQYRLASHIFVHTEKMRQELMDDFAAPRSKVSVIPFGINNTTPTTALTGEQARGRLGLEPGAKALLFFGQIAPYKGLEFIVDALPRVLADDPSYRLLIAGKVKKGCEAYWRDIEARLLANDCSHAVIRHIEHLPDADVETYFKAADVLVLPYVSIFQSGVPFLAYSYGLPVIATDVGSLRDDVVEAQTGFVCPPQDPAALADVVRRYFGSTLYRDLEATTRPAIREHANVKHSWTRVAAISELVYRAVHGDE